MTARLLALLNRARVWLNRAQWRRRALAHQNRLPEPGSPVAVFRDNEEIPLRGIVWRVGKRIGGPDPVVLLHPIRQTAAAEKALHGALKKQHRRLQDERAAKARAAVKDHQLVDRLTR